MYHKSQVSFLEGMSSANQWCVPDEVHDVLSVDFDRSFSCLEADLCSSSNAMSSTVFAVPEISAKKEEVRNSLNPSVADTFRCLQDISGDVVSNSHGSEKCQIECYPVSIVHGKKIRYSQLTDIDCTNSVKRFCINKDKEHSENFQVTRCRPHSLSAPELRTTSSHFYSSGSVINTILSQVVQLPVIPPLQTIDQGNQGPPPPFHCVLLASTSVTTKINEETLTYLNQGQPYEVKIKKNAIFPYEKNMLFKSIIHIGFQERRLQFMEKEQIKEWQTQRFGERILEIDVPLSYGVLEAVNSPTNINECEFIWDSTHDCGVFLKVNCISTEFTAKKHGGEKGVPFRIVVETYALNNLEKLHSASCQVKVFKPKGADRKHKTDREKLCKRLQSDKEKYHPQYEYTIFRDLCLSDSWASVHSNISSYISGGTSPTPSSPVSSGCSPHSPPLECLLDSPKKESYDGTQATSTTETQEIPDGFSERALSITHNSTTSECIAWLQKNMFDSYVKDFSNFTGADFLNLTRADLIDICGAANGIRLYNALHKKGCLTTYVRLPTQKAYSAIYLKTAKVLEFVTKIKSFCGLPNEYNCEFYVSGPAGTRVIVTDEVVCNMLQDSLFVVECIEGSCDEQCCVFLKQMVN
ncbi:transcription factor CP2-like protein 1 [Trichonephila clavata]|uniref:Transcription factor CP2-like protein 1 n=1 Tax=Trichonephila clavata TaxID=2740835 RepID=A0A8X6LKA6_TRICU|nr:transcription factor CP2-like protein 1 [Trichonephila clavata]